MRRAGKRLLGARGLVAAATAALSLCWSAPALAFHAGSVFDKPPGAGGGGGLFYAGAPFDHGWTCALCHTEAPGKIRVRLRVEPTSLFESFKYTPGQTYTFTATLEGETKGIGSPLSNYNALVIAITDEAGLPAGTIGGYAPEDFYAGGPALIATAGQKVGQTEWAFSFTAPPAETGTVKLHLAAVDGNGADSPPGATLTDPFGDDLFTGIVTLTPEGALAEAPPPPIPSPRGPWGAGAAAGVIALGLRSMRAGRRAARKTISRL